MPTNRIVTLKDESNNELYPQTIGSAVYCTDPSTNQSETVQAIIDSIYGGAGGSGGSGGSGGGSGTVSASDVTLSVTSSVPFITIGSNPACNMSMPTFSTSTGTEVVTIGNNDRLLITDNSAASNGKAPIRASSIKFGTSTTQFLANNGTWATPSLSVSPGPGNSPGAFVGSVGGTSLYVEPARSGYGTGDWPQGSVRPIASTAGLRDRESSYAFLGKKVSPPDPASIITYFTDFSKGVTGDFIAIPVLTDVGTIEGGEKAEYVDSVPYIILPAELTTGKDTLATLIGALPTSPK